MAPRKSPPSGWIEGRPQGQGHDDAVRHPEGGESGVPSQNVDDGRHDGEHCVETRGTYTLSYALRWLGSSRTSSAPPDVEREDGRALH